jgi:hypothetical protein
METSTSPVIAQAPSSAVEPALGLIVPPRGPSHDSEAFPGQRNTKDPHGFSDVVPSVFAAYRIALECHPKLLNRTITEEAVHERLHKLVPGSALRVGYVTRQAFKFINPYGHGANSTRFRNETLGWFRQMHPQEAHLTAGFIMFLCAAKWWIQEQGRRSVIPRMNPLTTSDLDAKLKSFGFLADERRAFCRLLGRERR